MKLEVGKWYVLRNVEVIGPLSDYGGGDFRFTARGNSVNRLSWRIDGSERIDRGESDCDIVSECVEPQPEPLRWVENCKPDKPGIWAVKGNVRDYAHLATESDVKDEREFSTGTWCYLGPIPEILPPKKKVVQRLWLERLSSSTQDGTVKTVFTEHWMESEQGNASHWIRTDETREVEQ